MDSRYVLHHAYLAATIFFGIIVAKVLIVMMDYKYGSLIGPATIGVTLIAADAFGLQVWRTRFYFLVFRLRVAGALFLMATLLLWFSGEWRRP
jgi:hypothetical protein